VYEAAAPSFQPVRDPAALNRVRGRYGLGGRIILYVGTIEPRKNLPKLIEAFAQRMLAGELAHSLVCVGPYGWKSRGIDRLIANSRVGDAISFTGYVPFEDLPALYSLAEMFVYPSMYEGFGLPVVEAMACGIPVITGGAAALAEVGGQAVAHVDRLDVDSLGQALVDLARDRGKRERMSAAGVGRALEFSWDRAARESLAIYRVVARPRRVAARPAATIAPSVPSTQVDVLFGQAYFLRFDPKLW
jgi:glycosyltransferase involved in cell wall biosynthesis